MSDSNKLMKRNKATNLACYLHTVANQRLLREMKLIRPCTQYLKLNLV